MALNFGHGLILDEVLVLRGTPCGSARLHYRPFAIVVVLDFSLEQGTS